VIKTDPEDPQPYQEALEVVRKTLAKLNRHIDNKTGSTADLTRMLRIQIELSKVVDQQNIREIQVTWVRPEWLDKEYGGE
jgi:hypothetical protein